MERNFVDKKWNYRAPVLITFEGNCHVSEMEL
jgi:hypothetical protein